MSTMRGLDDRWLPSLAARARSIAHSLRLLRNAVAGPYSAFGDPARAEPALAGSIAMVLVAGMLVAIFGPHDPYDHDRGIANTIPPAAVIPPPPQQTLGAPPGLGVASYLTAASFRLRHFGEISRGRPGYALVSLRAFETPAQAIAQFNGLNVVRVYLHVPGSPLDSTVYPIEVHTLATDLVTGMQLQARGAVLNARTYEKIASGYHPTSKRDKQIRTLYEDLARGLAFEGSGLGHSATCRCVFSVIVRGAFPTLSYLAKAAFVRAVDPADPSLTLTELTIFPLRPDVTVVVPKPGVLGVG